MLNRQTWYGVECASQTLKPRRGSRPAQSVAPVRDNMPHRQVEKIVS
jgi:hypothetical protein